MILGNGGREHALAWKFARSNRITGLYCVPGNPGTAELATNLELDPNDFEAVTAAAKKHRIDIVFVGPEAPLAAGIIDHLTREGIAAIGPGAEPALLESSKTFAKAFMQRNAVPTARAETVRTNEQLDAFIENNPGPVVVKMDGLAAGKGVGEFERAAEAAEFAREALQSGAVLLEEKLEGYEVSIFALMDPGGFKVLPPCADYKKAGEKSTGPNTGGMGAICPVPWVAPEMLETIQNDIVAPSVTGLRTEGLAYTGVLYIGVMVTESGPKVLEYNVRFGDPETQVVLPMLRADMLDICEAMLEGRISKTSVETDEVMSVGVVVASAGYPGPYERGIPIEIEPAHGTRTTPKSLDRLLFHAGTRQDGDLALVTDGGRCFTCVCRDYDLIRARAGAYSLARRIHFDGAWFRGDIASRVFGE
ncbi:MAG: phosphoribosylamine--glycine ligase [Spirochaetota bacterium]